METHGHSHQPNRYAVIPTPHRLGIDVDLTGQGITVAFLDSGFYPHPDLTEPGNRIVRFVDVHDPAAVLDPDRSPEPWDWHGTQTSVVAAGNGHLSNGIYRGLCPDAGVVLVKVSDRGRVSDAGIAAGLRWLLQNHVQYGIRIASLSLGGDEDLSYRDSLVDRLAEEAVRAGITLVVAAGNSGCGDSPRPIPPANAPSVITVGGYDDGNRLDGDLELYCSSYGPTLDGLIKPEILGPAIWVAAPILPKTRPYEEAEALSAIASVPDYLISKTANQYGRAAGLDESLGLLGPEEIRVRVETSLRAGRIVSTHYQHVDGTSFAAPIVASLIALMLQADPALTPSDVKRILVGTSRWIAGKPLLRQGYGMVDALRALQAARGGFIAVAEGRHGSPRIEQGRIVFEYTDPAASSVAVAGEFNSWDPSRLSMSATSNGTWRTEMSLPPPGRYQYKLVVDGHRWLTDPANLLRVPDNLGGENSVLCLV